MEGKAPEKAIKSALAEIAEKFDLNGNLMMYTKENIYKLNEECARLVHRYIEAGEIAIGPVENCILIHNAPLDILPLIPLYGGLGVKEYGTYTVICGPKMIGRVTYSGRPAQNEVGTVVLGVNTEFTPQAEFVLEIGDESSPLPENFWKELLGDEV